MVSIPDYCICRLTCPGYSPHEFILSLIKCWKLITYLSQCVPKVPCSSLKCVWNFILKSHVKFLFCKKIYFKLKIILKNTDQLSCITYYLFLMKSNKNHNQKSKPGAWGRCAILAWGFKCLNFLLKNTPVLGRTWVLESHLLGFACCMPNYQLCQPGKCFALFKPHFPHLQNGLRIPTLYMIYDPVWQSSWLTHRRQIRIPHRRLWLASCWRREGYLRWSK